MNYVIGILIIAVIVALGIWYTKWSEGKTKAQVWDGTVVKKWIAKYTDEDGSTTEKPMIEVQLADGKKKKANVLADTYNSLNEGDKVEKRAGEMTPVKV